MSDTVRQTTILQLEPHVRLSHCSNRHVGLDTPTQSKPNMYESSDYLLNEEFQSLQLTSSITQKPRVVFRIEETWRLWCKFLDDYSRFEEWLKTAELTAANPDSADVLYTSAKEELKKFEVSQQIFVSLMLK